MNPIADNKMETMNNVFVMKNNAFVLTCKFLLMILLAFSVQGGTLLCWILNKTKEKMNSGVKWR